MKKLFVQTFGWPLSPKHWTLRARGHRRASSGCGVGISGAGARVTDGVGRNNVVSGLSQRVIVKRGR